MKSRLKAMKSMAVATAICAACTTNAGAATKDGFGVGVIVGEPTGISLKKWTDDTHAVDAALAFSLTNGNAFQFHADYLIHETSGSIPELKGNLPWYYGIGGRVKADDGDTRVGVRVPLGISYMFADAPLDFFAEVAPIVDIAPYVSLRLNGALGLRYYFK
ncbi:MAG: hypothetical protein HGB04_08720 [Chlorobiaceae bacterium]|nr:hypothetical protein [Chlorobiaceae bacterium]